VIYIILLLVARLVVVIVLVVLIVSVTSDPDSYGYVPNVVLWAMDIVIYYLYYALMESSRVKATLGKMAVGIKVTSLDGCRLTFGSAMVRNLGKIISASTLGIGFVMASFTPKKQALHDMIPKGFLVVLSR